jgi:hypothetical protein
MGKGDLVLYGRIMLQYNIVCNICTRRNFSKHITCPRILTIRFEWGTLCFILSLSKANGHFRKNESVYFRHLNKEMSFACSAHGVKNQASTYRPSIVLFS